MAKLQPCIKLNNGQEMPVIGLGTRGSYEDKAVEAIRNAINLGYRHIDTAYAFGNEREVGNAINEKIMEGKIKREDIFLVTKLSSIHHHRFEVEDACRKSLKNLNTDYIDLYLMDFPVGEAYCDNINGVRKLVNTDYLETWIAMEKLVYADLVRGIGLSNFNAQQIERIVQNCNILPVVNQVECHPGFNQKKLIEFCREKRIVITAYCPLARPKPQKWPRFLYDQKTLDIAKRYERTPIQICLRYLIQLGCSVIPKSVNKEHLAENFNCFGFELSAEDMKIMDSFNTRERLEKFLGTKTHPYYPFDAEF